MLETIMAKRIPEFLDREEVFLVLTGDAKALDKQMVSMKLSKEARRLLEVEARRYDVDKTKALEILLREVRELRKRKK